MFPASEYLEDFQGIANASSILLDGTLQRLPDQPCRFFSLSSWSVADTVNFDSVKPTAVNLNNVGDQRETVFYGFNGRLFAEVLVGQTTPLMPINNLNQVCVRAGIDAGVNAKIYFAWFI